MRQWQFYPALGASFGLFVSSLLPNPSFALPSSPVPPSRPPVSGPSLPPPTDIPEEVLRTEIITEARSPLDGQPLSAAAYAELQAQLSEPPILNETLSTDLRQTVFLLQIRRGIRTIFPFLLR